MKVRAYKVVLCARGRLLRARGGAAGRGARGAARAARPLPLPPHQRVAEAQARLEARVRGQLVALAGYKSSRTF